MRWLEQFESATAVPFASVSQNSNRFFNSTPIFLFFPLIFLYLEMLTPWFYPAALGKFNGSNINAIIFITVISMLCFFSLPVLYAKILLRESPADFGLRRPANLFKALLWTLAALLLLEPYIVYFTHLPVFKNYYAVQSVAWWKLIAVNLFIFPIQYFAEEFFFRGFLFIGIWRRLKWHSFWITDIIFTYSHFNKPFQEVLLCIPASIILNILTLNTKSIYPAVIVHSCLGMTLCVLVNMH